MQKLLIHKARLKLVWVEKKTPTQKHIRDRVYLLQLKLTYSWRDVFRRHADLDISGNSVLIVALEDINMSYTSGNRNLQLMRGYSHPNLI